MILFASILDATVFLVHSILSLYTWVVIIATLITWVNPDPYNPIVRTLRALTEPVFWRVRRALPFVYINGIDLSPIVVILGIQFFDIVLVRTLSYLAVRLSV